MPDPFPRATHAVIHPTSANTPVCRKNRSVWLLLLAPLLALLLPASEAHGERLECRPDLPRLTGDPVRPPARSRTIVDTIWFGGDDGTGYAVEDGVWDFEGAGGAGDFQGWMSVDLTDNADVYLQRVSGADFATDPCNPMMGFGDYQIWCGIHEEEANELDYVTGIGYGNEFCQRALSPVLPAGDVAVAFDYFHDAEDGFDYTYVYVRCLDGAGLPLEDGLIELDAFTGVLSSPQAPGHYAGSLPASAFPAGTDQVQLELRFESDSAFSDEDGLYDCACGAFAADNISFQAGAEEHFADFEAGENGYTFDKCEAAGSYLGLVDEGTYDGWLDDAGGFACQCPLSGWALETVDEAGSPYLVPGHPSGQHERLYSGIVERGGYSPETYNTTVVQWSQFSRLDQEYGTFYRVGYSYYPFTSEGNPEPHWSPRMGRRTHQYSSYPSCDTAFTNLSTLDGEDGAPLPPNWEKLRFTYDVFCSCEAFAIPSTVCLEEGNTLGSPLLDNVRVGLTRTPDAPEVAWDWGHVWTDGYGQRFPTYLEPADVGNTNIVRDLSGANIDPDEKNDWHGDSALIQGPYVDSETNRWLVELCFRVTRKGPRQDLIPTYLHWKARLAGDPETEYVCVLMDSLETAQGVWRNKFETYFHEEDPGFDPAYPDRCTAQEILPDSIWTPGTAIEYFYRSYWYNGGTPPSDYYEWPPGRAEFEILPRMALVPGEPYEVQWPSILYIDAFNHGAQAYIEAALTFLGLEWDRFDYLHNASGTEAPIGRSYGGTTFNPGGYGNNGLTLQQALGYRLIFLDRGTFGVGGLERKDWAFYQSWLDATECGVVDIRRGFLFTGTNIASTLHDHNPDGRDFLANTLGAVLVAGSLREYADVSDDCLALEASDPHAYETNLPIQAYGNGCPEIYDYDLLGVSGADGALGNLDYHGDGSVHSFAQVVRDRVVPNVSNWRSSIAGFSPMTMSYVGCAGEECARDSACIAQAAADFLGTTFDWMTAGADPFDAWSFECGTSDVIEETHLTGPADYLYAARPNPFRQAATIRFSLSAGGPVKLRVYDVAGRVVRTLIEENLEGGQEHSVAWDGRDDTGHPVESGVYWSQLTTGRGFASSKRMIVLP